MNTIERVCISLKKHLADGAFAPGSRLPSLNRLALQFGASRSTMWKALSLLKKESAIHINPRGAIFAGQPGASGIDAPSDGLLWQRTQVRIGQDVIAGAFESRELPPIAKLALRYGVSIRTIKKALAGLLKQDVLAVQGRRYLPVRNRLHTRRSPIMFISFGTTGGGITLGDPRIQQVVESFERECARLGYVSLVEGFNDQDPRSFMELSSTIKKLPGISGFIVNVWVALNETYLRRWNDLFLYLAGRNAPVVIIDQSGSLLVSRELLKSRLVRILRISSEKAGEKVAEVMLRTGHERIAYVTPFFNAPWAQARYAGVCRYIKSFGPPGAVVLLYALEKPADQIDLMLAIMELGKEDIRSLYHNRNTEHEIREFTDRLGKTGWQELKSKITFSDTTGTIRSTARFLAGLAKKPHNITEYELLLDSLQHIASNRSLEDYLLPFLQDIYGKNSATAWVCSDDKTALTAVSVLRSCNKKVPEDISVIGFDNWRAAYENQLSTFDFNMNGMVQQALLMILDEKTFSDRPVISEVDGYVVERRTTRR